MMPKQHFLLSVPIVIIYFYIVRDILYAAIMLSSAVLIDADHLFDYISAYKTFNLRHFLGGKWIMKKLFIAFHSYELLAVLLAIFILSGYSIIIPLLLGFSYHIFLDMIHYSHKNRFLFYSLVYRMINRFEKEELCNGE